MKPSIQVWRPRQTCDCTVYEYRDENGDLRFASQQEAHDLHVEIFKNYPSDTVDPLRNLKEPTKICVAHTSLGEETQLYDALLDEGRRLMGAMSVLKGGKGNQETKQVSDLISEKKVNQDGSNAGLGFKPGIKMEWSFSGEGKDRILHVNLKGFDLSIIQKKFIQDFFSGEFGEGKVII